MHSQPVRLLYIEDDAGLATLVKKDMERRGWVVELAHDGIAGLARLAQGGIDVVALDHYMAGQDGLTTLAEMRKMLQPPPVVYVTGTDDSKVAVAALKAGAADYVFKDVREDFFTLLHAALTAALELQTMRQAREAAEAEVSRKNKELEALSRKLAKYLSPQIYNSIFTGAQSVEIASNRKKLTVFFSDIADFTGTTEKLESEELTQLLNRYLTEMARIALEFGATIDKYIGDAVLAFFGDPESKGVKQDARACVRMAIAMQRRMRELQAEWQELGAEEPLQMRIGINTGFCTVGNFGSEDRMDYTIIGSIVNLASRLQSQVDPGGILIGYETFALVKDDVATEEQSAVTVKGLAEPVRCYKVLGIYDELVRQGSVIREEEDGLRLLLDLKKQDRAHAIEVLESVLTRLKQ
jgi:class 3 adenylate cyclase